MSGICDKCQRLKRMGCGLAMDGLKICDLYEHESNYERLFGTPERAAQLIADNCEFLSYCGQCWIQAENCDGKYSTVLEWLRGESDGE